MINKLKNHIPIILTILTVSGCLEMEINQPPNSETGSSFTAVAEIIFIKDDAADWGRRMIFAVNKPVGWIITCGLRVFRIISMSV